MKELDIDAMQTEADAAIEAAKVPTEAEMRDAEVPWPNSMDDLTAYINGLVDRPHDYGTCVYAMSMAATAAFYYVSSKLGSTGFQASCADLDIVRRNRRIEGPFMLIDLSNALYPQYDLRERLEKALDDARPWLAEQARKKLAKCEADGDPAHPNVMRHWKALAAFTPEA